MRRRHARLVAESGLLGLVVGVLVVAPWVGEGYLLLLDWVSGPNLTLNAGVYGLSGSSLDAAPFRVATQLLRGVVGTSVTAWLLILVFFPLGAAGMSTLVRGGRWRRHTAAVVFVCNPFVVDRVRAGHVALLLGIACLPWLMRSAEHARTSNRWVALRPAAWFAVGMAISPHVFWLGGAVLVAVAMLPRPTVRDLVRTLQIGLSAAVVYAYGVVLYLADIDAIAVSGADLRAFATVPGPGGLLVTLLSLHGFWRDFEDQARTDLPTVLAIGALLVTLAAVLVGLARAWANDRTLGRPAVALTVLGLVLASGATGPFADFYTLLFERVPLFAVMREQQKWLALTVLGFAIGIGAAAEWAVGAVRLRLAAGTSGSARRLGSATAGVAVGLACTTLALVSAPALLWGLGGRVATSEYPEGWYQADALIGNGDEAVLFLPWHGYQPFAFTDGRGVATPAEAFFRRPAISSDAVELAELRTSSTSLRQAYVDQLVARGGGGAFGRLVAPLGVRWVAVARGEEDDAYAWVARQPDLERVLSTESMDVFRVIPDGTGRVEARRDLADLDAVVAAARTGVLGTEAVTAGAGPPAADSGELPSTAAGGIERSSRTTWTVAPGAPGWVVVPEEWSTGWQVEGRPGVPTAAGTVALPVAADAAVVEFAPWTWLRRGLAVSLLGLAGLLVLGLVEHRADIALFVGRHSRRHPEARA